MQEYCFLTLHTLAPSQCHWIGHVTTQHKSTVSPLTVSDTTEMVIGVRVTLGAATTMRVTIILRLLADKLCVLRFNGQARGVFMSSFLIFFWQLWCFNCEINTVQCFMHRFCNSHLICYIPPLSVLNVKTLKYCQNFCSGWLDS